jgi:hypothetical protein
MTDVPRAHRRLGRQFARAGKQSAIAFPESLALQVLCNRAFASFPAWEPWVAAFRLQGLGLASISEARASACVSIYSRMFVSLPFRSVMAKTQSSSNVLFVALTFP